MPSDDPGSRPPNGRGVPADFAHANMTENLVLGTFAEAQHTAWFDEGQSGSGAQTVNICVDHPKFGLMILGCMTWGGDEETSQDQRTPDMVAEYLAPAEHADTGANGSHPGIWLDNDYTPEMRQYADELRQAEPSYTEKDIDDRVRYRFANGQDKQAGFRQLQQTKQDFLANREMMLSVMNDAEHARTVAEMLSDPHTVLTAASFAPGIWGAIPSLGEAWLYLHEGNYRDAGISGLSAIGGVVFDAGIIKGVLKGGKAAAAALNEGSHAAQIAADTAKVEKQVAVEATKTEGTAVAKRGEASELIPEGHALVPYYPSANGFLGETVQTTLEIGQTIDRYGGSPVSRFFSPVGTPAAMRALPPGVANQTLRSFRILKPFSVESGRVAPAFEQLGLGTQFRSSMTLDELLSQGFLKEITP